MQRAKIVHQDNGRPILLITDPLTGHWRDVGLFTCLDPEANGNTRFRFTGGHEFRSDRGETIDQFATALARWWLRINYPSHSPKEPVKPVNSMRPVYSIHELPFREQTKLFEE